MTYPILFPFSVIARSEFTNDVAIQEFIFFGLLHPKGFAMTSSLTILHFLKNSIQ